MQIPIDKLPYMLSIGRQGEKNYQTIEFDLSPWLDTFSSGEVLIVHKRPDGHVRHAARGNLEDASISWLISAYDTQVAGKGMAEIRLYVDDKIVKTAKFVTSVIPSIHEEGTPDEPYVPQDITEEIYTALAEKLDKNLGAENSGKFLIVGQNGVITTESLEVWQGGDF